MFRAFYLMSRLLRGVNRGLRALRGCCIDFVCDTHPEAKIALCRVLFKSKDVFLRVLPQDP